MPWRKNDYPASMKNLQPRVREKAVDIANALLKDGYEEGRAIAIATAKAKEWDEDHPKHEDSKLDDHFNRSAVTGKSKSGMPDSARKGSSNLHVVPDGDGWAVKEEGAQDTLLQAETKAEAVDKAKQWASDANKSAIVHRKDGTVEHSHNYS
jgi:uncharacterized protein YdaT